MEYSHHAPVPREAQAALLGELGAGKAGEAGRRAAAGA
jgi:hypothetical protein